MTFTIVHLKLLLKLIVGQSARSSNGKKNRLWYGGVHSNHSLRVAADIFCLRASTLVLRKARRWKDAPKLICTVLVQKMASQSSTVVESIIMAKPISHFGVDSLVTVEVIK